MITRLQVRNFKSLRDVDISLGPLNALVGPNMSGKSNIFDALLFLYQIFFPQAGTQGVNYAFAQRGGVSEVLWKGSDNKLITIALECSPLGPGVAYQYRLELIAGAGDFTDIQNESLKIIKDGREQALLITEGNVTHLWNADGKDLGQVGRSSASSVLERVSPDWSGYIFREWVRFWRYYHLVPLAMKQATAMSLGQILATNGENLSAWLMWLQTHSPDTFGRINEVVRDLFPDVVQIKTIPTPDGKVHLQILERGLKRPTTVWQSSDGFLEIVALLSLIYVPPQLSGSLFIIEEPENHLHPKLLETLVALIRQVRQEVMSSEHPLAQLLFTTQSPYLVDQFHLDEIIWVEKRNGETKVFHPSDKKHLRELVENKDLGLGDLMYAGALGQEK